MIIAFLLWPIFFVLGLVFGILSPIVAICNACKQETKKWQTYVRNASAVSSGHQKRIKLLAKCLLAVECFKCNDEDNLRGKKLLLDYYKLGHQIGFSFHIIIVTVLKFALFNPFWTACSASLEDLKQMDDAANLGEGLLRSPSTGRRERKSVKSRVRMRDPGSNEPGMNYRVENIQPGELEPPNPYLPPSEDHGGWGSKQPAYGGRNDANVSNKKPQKSSTPEASPWGDWEAG